MTMIAESIERRAKAYSVLLSYAEMMDLLAAARYAYHVPPVREVLNETGSDLSNLGDAIRRIEDALKPNPSVEVVFAAEGQEPRP